MVGKNNPFNIRNNRHNKWLGQTGSRKGFCCFVTLDYGVRAAAIIVKNYYSHGLRTIRKIVTRFAPPSENDTERYIKFVSDYSSLHPDYVISGDIQFVMVLSAMSQFEGNFVHYILICKILDNFNFNYPHYEEEDN